MGAICPLILLFRGKVWCPQPAAGTQIKNGTRIAQTLHGSVFHGSIFDNISSVIFGSWFWFSRICKCCSTSSSGCLFSALFSCSPWAIVEISVRYSLPNGHVLGGIYAQVGQRACPCWATCLPMLGTLLAQKCIVFGLKGTGLLPKRYIVTIPKE